jgi:hypothetical protein
MWLLVLLAIPGSLGRQLLGDTWGAARLILIPVGLTSVAMVASTGPLISLRALGAVKVSMAVRLLAAIPSVAVPVVGGALAAAPGFAYGSLAIAVLTTALFWAAYRKTLPSADWAEARSRNLDR